MKLEKNASNYSFEINLNASFNPYIRTINSILSFTGIVCNIFVWILLYYLRRRHCASYFLLRMMSICDFLYCLVYLSIGLTIDQYVNLINHQILCPLSFFLTPMSFTGSTLLLLICQIHLLRKFERKYDTILGQITGRLSAVFVFAFVIIRSVLGSTSIELISDAQTPDIQHCIIDMNTPVIVAKVQNINHIFAEVTDIMVYLAWISILFSSFIFSIPYRNYTIEFSNRRRARCQCLSYRLVRKTSDPRGLIGISTDLNTNERMKNRKRHRDVSWIILTISLISILLYFPIMSNKFFAMELLFRHRTIFNQNLILFLQDIQQTAHLICLNIRFIPYLIFNQRIRSLLHRMIGWKIQRKSSTTNPQDRRFQKYIFRCHCSTKHQRRQSLELDLHKHKQRRTLPQPV